MSSYQEFLAGKALRAPMRGMAAAPAMPSHLHDYQAECTRFGIEAGSWMCALDTGLGKTACELAFSAAAAEAENRPALLLTPLAVARQIEREGLRWGYEIRVIREQADVRAGINVCNYDRLDKVDPDAFGSVALDESSILKSFTGKMSRAIIGAFSRHRFRMAATATPAPNDHTELAQQAAFCGVMTRDEMLVRWFINDAADTGTWRLKGHAVDPFWNWIASWARMASHPRDLGSEASGFDLPPLRIVRHYAADSPVPVGGGLLFAGPVSATSLHDVKRATSAARADVVAGLVAAEPAEPWVIWCDTDYESGALAERLPSFVEVRGSHPIERKEDALAAFADGSVLGVITKGSVCGWGLNWQHCARVAYVGRSFSYESWYQTVRRCWRYGQLRSVDVHLVVAEGEDQIGRVIDKKAGDHGRMQAAMVAAMRRAMGRDSGRRVAYEPTYDGRWPSWLAGVLA